MRHAINYPALMSCLTDWPVPEIVDGLREVLPECWCDAYAGMPGAGTEIVSIDLGTYGYLFDMTAERVLVAYGTSIASTAKRDSGRMQGFLGKIGGLFKGRTDKGHIMSHRQGGGMDINLFPQRPDVNRGRGEAGRAYRALERHCASNPGSFCFSRLIYDDATWVPAEIEYGVLMEPRQFRVERFTNAAV